MQFVKLDLEVKWIFLCGFRIKNLDFDLKYKFLKLFAEDPVE